LPVCGQSLENGFDIGKEAHVQHAIGLVENDGVDMGEGDRAPLHMVDQTSGGSDGQIPGASQVVDLAAHVHSADEKNGPAPEVLPVFPGRAFDLAGQLAGGAQDENLVANPGPLGALVSVERRQKKPARFS
jgi:hypothetical protein